MVRICRRYQYRLFFFVLFFFLNLSLVQAQPKEGFLEDEKINPLSFTMTPVSEEIERGEVYRLPLQLSIDQPFKAYMEAFDVHLTHPALRLEDFYIEPVIEFYDVFSKSIVEGFEKVGLASVYISVSPEFDQNRIESDLELTYQACTEEFCLFPITLKESFTLSVKGEFTSPSGFSRLLSGDFQSLLNLSIPVLLSVIFLFGLLTSFTPCIYPLIPITVAVIGAHKNSSFKGSFLISLSYVLGIALTYALMGLMVAQTGAMLGSLLMRPEIVFFFGGLFFLMGLSLLGFFEVRIFQSFQWLQKIVGNKPGLRTAFLSGLVFGVVASPCVGPLMISVLAVSAQTQSPILGFTFLFVYALGLGLPLLFLGTFQSILSRRPPSGVWMVVIKHILGFALVGIAYFYFEPLIPMPYLIMSFAILFGIWIWRQPACRNFSSAHRLSATLAIIGLVASFLLFTFSSYKALEHMKYGAPSLEAVLPWEDLKADTLSEALSSDQPVMIDFYADWCLACRELDRTTFRDDRVAEALGDWRVFKFDATRDSPELREFRDRFNVYGLPTILFFDSEGLWVKEKTLYGFLSAEDLLRHIEGIE